MENRDIVRVLIKGGVVSPAHFLKIIEVAKSMNNSSIHFGSRQDLLFHVNPEKLKKLTEVFSKMKIDFIYEKQLEAKFQNIVSSYVASDILPSTQWVTSGTYLYVLEQLENRYSLKINLVDPKQNLVPMFHGNVNFIASQRENYWHLKLKFTDKNELLEWPVLVHTDDIAEVTNFIEKKHIVLEKNVRQLFDLFNESYDANNRNIDVELNSPKGFFPYYEGVNLMQSGTDYWAGFYWRNNKYNIQFLQEVCELCSSFGVAKLSITTWKSLLIKGIKEKDKLKWEQLIGRFGINMRHSSVELNWHLPVLNSRALALKKYLVKSFDKVDVRTFGLTFSLFTPVKDAFTSVVIVEDKINRILGPFEFLKSFTIYYSENFDLNATKYIKFQSDLSRHQLPKALIELSRKYYDFLSKEKPILSSKKEEKITEKSIVFQCQDCYSIYDEEEGDNHQNVAKRTKFENLPEEYCCGVCEAEKSTFQKKEVSLQF